MLDATLRKLNTTLQDIDQLESERQTLEDRLSDVRQSMRKSGASVRLLYHPLYMISSIGVCAIYVATYMFFIVQMDI